MVTCQLLPSTPLADISEREWTQELPVTRNSFLITKTISCDQLPLLHKWAIDSPEEEEKREKN